MTANREVVYEFGSFRFDPLGQVLLDCGREVTLPRRTVLVLEALLERPGQLIERQRLEDLVWPDTAVGAASLTEAVSHLRQVLRDDPKDPRFIQTVHRRGYRFVAELSMVDPRVVAESPPQKPRRALGWRAASAAALVLALALIGLWPRSSPVEAPRLTPVRLEIEPPDGHELPHCGPMLAVSPDGRSVVFGAHREGRWRLFFRSLDNFEEHAIAGTESAHGPFFSPDGKNIGFFAGSVLKTVRLDGGNPVVIAQVGLAGSGAWVTSEVGEGSIVFAEGFASGLSVIPAGGGKIRVLTVPDPQQREFAHLLPQALPGRSAVLFTIMGGVLEPSRVAVVDLVDGRVEVLHEGSGGQFGAGHVLYANGGVLEAAPFDLANLAVTGPSSIVPERIRTDPGNPVPNFSVSRAGTLVYVPEPDDDGGYRLMSLSGDSARELDLPTRRFRNVALSPDGKRLALTILDGDRSDVWIGEVESGELFRLTTDAHNVEPLWTPDGGSVTYSSNRTGHFQIFVQSIDGGPAEHLLPSASPRFPSAWTADGSGLVFAQFNPITRGDIGLATRSGNEWSERWLVHTPAREMAASLSPNDEWLAFERAVDGRVQIFVQRLSATGPSMLVSHRGGERPRWTRDGGQLIYLRDGTLYAADVDLETSEFGAERQIEIGIAPAVLVPGFGPDEFLAIPSGSDFPPSSFRVVLNWADELTLAPSGASGPMPMALFSASDS